MGRVLGLGCVTPCLLQCTACFMRPCPFARRSPVVHIATPRRPRILRVVGWTTCALSGEPLQAPIVADWLGSLYNKAAVLGFLLARAGHFETEGDVHRYSNQLRTGLSQWDHLNCVRWGGGMCFCSSCGVMALAQQGIASSGDQLWKEWRILWFLTCIAPSPPHQGRVRGQATGDPGRCYAPRRGRCRRGGTSLLPHHISVMPPPALLGDSWVRSHLLEQGHLAHGWGVRSLFAALRPGPGGGAVGG